MNVYLYCNSDKKILCSHLPRLCPFFISNGVDYHCGQQMLVNDVHGADTSCVKHDAPYQGNEYYGKCVQITTNLGYGMVKFKLFSRPCLAAIQAFLVAGRCIRDSCWDYIRVSASWVGTSLGSQCRSNLLNVSCARDQGLYSTNCKEMLYNFYFF